MDSDARRMPMESGDAACSSHADSVAEVAAEENAETHVEPGSDEWHYLKYSWDVREYNWAGYEWCEGDRNYLPVDWGEMVFFKVQGRATADRLVRLFMKSHKAKFEEFGETKFLIDFSCVPASQFDDDDLFLMDEGIDRIRQCVSAGDFDRGDALSGGCLLLQAEEWLAKIAEPTFPRRMAEVEPTSAGGKKTPPLEPLLVTFADLQRLTGDLVKAKTVRNEMSKHRTARQNVPEAVVAEKGKASRFLYEEVKHWWPFDWKLPDEKEARSVLFHTPEVSS